MISGRAGDGPGHWRWAKYAIPPLIGVVTAALQATQAAAAYRIGGIPSSIAAGRVGWWELFVLSLPSWILFGLLIYPAVWLANRAPFGQGRLGRTLVVHVVGSILFATVFVVVGSTFRYWVFLDGASDLGYPQVLARYLQSFANMILLLYWGVVGTWSALAYYREGQRRAVASARLEGLWANARLEALRLQLQPHFLFNALNSIGARAVATGARDLSREIRTLGDFLRAHLRTDEHVVSLAEDLRMLGLYLKLQEMRFEDRLRVHMDVEEAALDARVPVLTLHTLVENAIQHAIGPSPDGGDIWITARVMDQRLRIHVEDTGGPASEGAQGHGIGLESLQVRARELFGPSSRVRLKPRGAGMQATVDLPLQSADEGRPTAGTFLR